MSFILTNATDAAVDEKLGLLAVRIPYVVKPESGEHPFALLKRALTYFPPELSEFSPLVLMKRNPKQRSDGAFDVTFDLEGHFKPDAAEGEEFTLDGTTSEDPIEAHDQLQMLIAKYKGKRGDDGKVVFPLTLEVNGQTERNPMHGVSSYLVPGLVWSKNYVSLSFGDSVVRGLGTIDSPPIGRQGQRPPSLAGGRNWLKIRAKADWRGNIWKISESWLLSGPGGWNPDVYRYT